MIYKTNIARENVENISSRKLFKCHAELEKHVRNILESCRTFLKNNLKLKIVKTFETFYTFTPGSESDFPLLRSTRMKVFGYVNSRRLRKISKKYQHPIFKIT